MLEQDYSALKLTVGEYGLMKSGSWQNVGITPNEEVALPPEQEAIQQLLKPYEDAQVQAAVTKLEDTVEMPMGGGTTDAGNATGSTTGDTTDTGTSDPSATGDTTTTTAKSE